MNLVDSPKDMAEHLVQVMINRMSQDLLQETPQEQLTEQMTDIAKNILARNQRRAVADIKEFYFTYCTRKRYRNCIESTTGDEDKRKMAKDLTDFVKAELVNERWDVIAMQGKMVKIAAIQQVVDLSLDGANALLDGHSYDVGKAAQAYFDMLEDNKDRQPRKTVGRHTEQPTESRRRKLTYDTEKAGMGSDLTALRRPSRRHSTVDQTAMRRTRRRQATELSGAKVGEFEQETKVVVFLQDKRFDASIDKHVRSGIWVRFPNNQGLVVSLADMRAAAVGSKDRRGFMQIFAPIPDPGPEQADISALDHTNGSNSGKRNRDCAGSTKMGDRGTSGSGIGGGASKEVETKVEGDNDSSSSIGSCSGPPAEPACFGFHALKDSAQREVTNAALWKDYLTKFSGMFPTVVAFARQTQFPPPTKPQLILPYPKGFSQPENLLKQEFLKVHAASLKVNEQMNVMRDLHAYINKPQLVQEAMDQANSLVGLHKEDGSYMICAILLAIQEQAGGGCGHYCFCAYFLTI